MTIEGRPELNVDWNAEYYKQRRSRMDDCLGDYMGDEETTPRRCYEDILSVCDEWINYHKENMNKWTELKSLMMGHREVNLDDYVKNLPAQQNPVYNDDGTTSYEYAAHVTLGDIHKFQKGSHL